MWSKKLFRWISCACLHFVICCCFSPAGQQETTILCRWVVRTTTGKYKTTHWKMRQKEKNNSARNNKWEVEKFCRQRAYCQARPGHKKQTSIAIRRQKMVENNKNGATTTSRPKEQLAKSSRHWLYSCNNACKGSLMEWGGGWGATRWATRQKTKRGRATEFRLWGGLFGNAAGHLTCWGTLAS